MQKRITATAVTLVSTLFLVPAIGTAQITEIIDATGDGAGNGLSQPFGVDVDSSGNVYVAGLGSSNVFKITPGGVITEIIDSTGDGAGNTFASPDGIAVDGAGNVYVAGQNSHNAFKITPGGLITEIIDTTGDGAGNTLASPRGVAIDGAGDVYVTGSGSDNAFKITDPGGANTITQIIDATGNGGGNTLNAPVGVAVDGSGDVYVAGASSDNAFRITDPGGANTITEIIDPSGDGSGNPLDQPIGIAVDGTSTVYVTGLTSNNAFQITSGGIITEIFSNGPGPAFINPRGVTTDASGNVYVAGTASQNAIKITDPGEVTQTVTQLIDSTGDGLGNTLTNPVRIAVDGAGSVYVTGSATHNAFKISPGPLASCTFRNGGGTNPPDYSCVTLPVLGTNWESTIGLAPTHGSVSAATAVMVGFGGATSGLFLPGGHELLVEPPFLFFISVGSALGAHSLAIPNDAILAGVSISTQGVRHELTAGFDPVTVLLNAQDLELGF